MAADPQLPALSRPRLPLNPRAPQKRREMALARARCAWVLSVDLASRAFHADMRVVVQTRGKVGRGSDDRSALARKVACYLAMVVANVQPTQLSQASGVDRSTIHSHASWVEDKRDEPAFDAQIAELETALLGMAMSVVMGRLGLDAPEAGA